MRTVQIVAVVGAVLVASPAFAQGVTPPPPPPPPSAPPAPPAPTPPRLQILRRPYFRDDSAARNRATLGMSLSLTGSKRDTLGVFVSRVVPDGPAERAGVVEGDRIAAINDVSLRASAADLDDPYAMGLPAHRLSRAVGKLTPGNTVKLRVYSGGHFRDVTVTAGKMGDVYRNAYGERNRAMLFSDMDLDAMIGPALAQIGPSLETMGPMLRDEMLPMLEEIGPRMQASVERAMRNMPRDIHIELHDSHP